MSRYWETILVQRSRHCSYTDPSSFVLLTSLSVPPNLEFIVDDVEDEWGYENQPFDFIHARFLAGSIRDWPRLMKQAFE